MDHLFPYQDLEGFEESVHFCIPPSQVSLRFFRQEYWSGLPFLSPGDLPDPGIEPRSPTFQADALPSEPPGKWVPRCC